MKLLKDKKGLEFKSAFYAIIVFSMIIIGVGIWVGEWNTAYSSGLTYDLGEDFDKLDTISSETNKFEGNLSAKSSVQGTDFEGTSIRGVYGILTSIFQPFRVLFGEGGMLDAVTDRFGMPNYIRQGLVSMILAAIAFTLIAAIFRLSRRQV